MSAFFVYTIMFTKSLKQIGEREIMDSDSILKMSLPYLKPKQAGLSGNERVWRRNNGLPSITKKYTLYTRSAGILAMVLILCVAVVIRDTLLQTVGVLVIFAGLLLGIQLINKWYLGIVAKLLHVDLDLASWKQYIEFNKTAKRAVLQIDAKTTEVSYAYMTGDFETAVQKAKEALELEDLKPEFKDILESYLIRSVVLSQPELSREELDALLNELTITEPILGKKTEQVSEALYDLTIAHQSNDYFDTLTNEFKYPQLEIIYYQALNATIKGDTARANELLSKLVHEDEELYVVRMAKVLLNGTVER